MVVCFFVQNRRYAGTLLGAAVLLCRLPGLQSLETSRGDVATAGTGSFFVTEVDRVRLLGKAYLNLMGLGGGNENGRRRDGVDRSRDAQSVRIENSRVNLVLNGDMVSFKMWRP